MQKQKKWTKTTKNSTTMIVIALVCIWTHALTYFLEAFYYYALIKGASVRSESNCAHPADEILLT